MTKLSTLVVTNRPQFVSWWTWNIVKQTRKPDEVIVVSNMEGTLEDMMLFNDVVKHTLRDIPKVEVHLMDPSSSIGELRQSALEASTGHAINYVDDDDWYHPWFFAELVRGIEEGCKIVAGAGHHRLVLNEMTLFRFGEVMELIHLPFCAVEGSLARRLRFAPTNINEDIWWLEQASTFAGKDRKAVSLEMPVMCMIHNSNTWNRATISGYEHAIQHTAETLTEVSWRTSRNHTGLLQVPEEEWLSTWQRLQGLKATLSF